MTIANMIHLLVILASVTFSLESEVSSVPGDNSNYVEGESQYIWIPDGNGVPHLQDLKASLDPTVVNTRNGARNEYWLFTRNNRNNPQIIIHGQVSSIFNSYFQPNRTTQFIIHGWNSNGHSDINTIITAAFLETQDCNVFVVDWRYLANSNYISAVYGVPDIGRALGNFIIWLHQTTGMDWNQIHIVGFSLGAHVAGNAGRLCGGRPARVTGLDPAGPLWGGNKDAINKDAGQIVEIIHTDAGILGMFSDVGHADMFPNGGCCQPGCWFNVCSHMRAYELFASSIYTDHFTGYECTNISQSRNNQCTGKNFKMGNGDVNKRGNGIFALSTGDTWPY